MKTFKIIGFIILAIILGFFALALFMKNEVNVEKKIIIKAPVEEVFAAVNNFHNWSHWSLWSDTSMNTTYEGPDAGIGAKMIWHDKKEGVGEMSIIESVQNEKITTQLFFKNTESKTLSHFTFKPVEGGIEVSWSLKSEGYSYPFGRFAAWMITKGLNNSFTKGLEKMKEVVESGKIGKSGQSNYTVETSNVEMKTYVSISDSGKVDELGGKFQNSMIQIEQFIKKNKLECTGYPISIWHNYNPDGISSYTAAMPISGSFKEDKTFKKLSTQSSKVIYVKHTGDYSKTYDAWMTLENYIKDKKLEINGNPWEEYVSDPEVEKDTAKWVTNIYYPIK